MTSERMPADGTRVYSEKLKGVDGPDCNIPGCRAPGMFCTGWLEFSTDTGWYTEFHCPNHGSCLGFQRSMEPLVTEVLKKERLQGRYGR